MARIKRLFPTGKYRLHLPKNPQSEAMYPIELEYSWEGTIKRVPTGISVFIKDWSAKGNNGRGELLPTYGSEYIKQNALLTRKVERFDALLSEYNDKHPNQMTIDVIDAIIHNRTLDQKDFIVFVNERLKSDYNRGIIGRSRYENGLSAMNMFREYLRTKKYGTYKDDSIYVSQITLELFEEYIEWRKDVKKNTSATINHSLTPIIKACQYGAEVGLVPLLLNQRIKELRINEKVSLEDDDEVGEVYDGKSLSEEQIMALVKFGNECEVVRRKEYIDMFLFAFHACGLRIVDVATLQWSNIDFVKKELRKVLVKTNKRHVIPLSKTAMDILLRWHEKRHEYRFVFGLVKEEIDLDDEAKLYNARINATKCVNQSLKVVGEALELSFPLTMHVARHTFAVQSLQRGLSMTVISRLLGHASTDVTEKVYARFLPETLSGELAKLDYSKMAMTDFK